MHRPSFFTGSVQNRDKGHVTWNILGQWTEYWFSEITAIGIGRIVQNHTALVVFKFDLNEVTLSLSSFLSSLLLLPC